MELSFSIAAHIVLIFTLVSGTGLISHQHIDYFRAVLAQHQGCPSNTLPKDTVGWCWARDGEETQQGDMT